MSLSLTGFSMPIFWWGLLLIILFSGILHWTPVSGRIDVLYFFPPVTGFMLIDSLLSGQDGAFTSAAAPPDPARHRARHHPHGGDRAPDPLGHARGAGRGLRAHRARQGTAAVRVIGLHALRNALIPVVTVIGLQVELAVRRRDPDRDDLLVAGGRQVAGRFDVPGATTRRCREACCLIATVVMLVNLFVDLLYGIINPRIRHGR